MNHQPVAWSLVPHGHNSSPVAPKILESVMRGLSRTPTVQSGPEFQVCRSRDQTTTSLKEFTWRYLALSSVRGVGGRSANCRESYRWDVADCQGENVEI